MEAEIVGTAIKEAERGIYREKKPVVIPYQPMLALHDVLVSVCSGSLGTWRSADVFFPGAGLQQQVLLLGLCMIPITYFGTFRLYSCTIYFPLSPAHMCKTFVLSAHPG
jgi:hypothetical protein